MQITLIGTGLMGKPMAERLLGSGHDVVVYNRTPEKAKPLEALGATIAPTATHAIQASPLTIFMVADAAAIGDILFPPRGKPNLQGRTILQMGTIAPEESMALAQEVRVGIGDYLEAPVLGSIAEVRAGQLIVMVGGSAPQWDRWVDLLKCFGPEPLLVGPVGHAAGLKLALNQLIASHIAAFSLSLSLIQRLLLTMNLYNPTGTQVAKLERNTWVSNDQDRFELNAGPESVMLVDNTLKGVVILLKIEDHNRITIPQAKFYLPSGRVSEVTADGWQVGNTIELKGTDIDLDGGVIEIQ